MTLEEFFTELESIPLVRTSSGLIRTPLVPGEFRVCPVCAVANKKLGTNHYTVDFDMAAAAINLPIADARAIATAADITSFHETEKLEPVIRRRLLRLVDKKEAA